MDVCRSAFILSIVRRTQFFHVCDLGGGSKLDKWIVSLHATRHPTFRMWVSFALRSGSVFRRFSRYPRVGHNRPKLQICPLSGVGGLDAAPGGVPRTPLSTQLERISTVLFRCIFVQNKSWIASWYSLRNVLATCSVSGSGFLCCFARTP